jgi:hypothetical protein
MSALVAVSLAGAAACTGTQAASGAKAGSTAATGAASASTVGATTADGGGGGAGTVGQPQASAAAPSPSGAAAIRGASGAPSCGNEDLKFALGRVGVAMGHTGAMLNFTNTATHACTLQGYPGAAVMNGPTVVLDAARTLNGYIGDMRQLDSAPVVTLRPGATASAVLEWSGDYGQRCYASGQGTLEVTAPNTTRTITASSATWQIGAPGGICSGFQIHPVIAGPIG